MKYELAALAQRLRLTKEQLKNPRVIALLEEHLAKPLPEIPTEHLVAKPPAAVNHMYGYQAFVNSEKKRKK